MYNSVSGRCLLHGLIQLFPVGVSEQPSCRWLDMVDDLVDGHEWETDTVDQLTSELLSIGAVEVDPPNYCLHATVAAAIRF